MAQLPLPLRSTVAAIVALGCVAALLVAGSADASKSFRPVRTTEHAVFFKPRGLAPQVVRKAKVHFRHHGGKVRRRHVPTVRVRSALSRSSLLRVRKPKPARGGKLEVVVSNPTPPPSSTPPTSTPTTGCELGSFSSANMPGSCWRPYAADSPFNRRVPVNPQISPDSEAAVKRYVGFWAGNADLNFAPRLMVGVADTTWDYGHPVYYSQPGDPVYTVHCAESWGRCDIEGLQVAIPNAAKPAGGTDGHMAVIDQATGWEYDFWQVRSKPSGGGTITISWGGRTRIDGDGLGSNGTAAHFGALAGIVRPQELASGEINHALFLVVKCTNGKSVYPAGNGVGRSCSEMGLSNAGAPPMGAHFYLDMTDAEIDAAPVPDWKRAIMRAAAHYGLFVGDTGGTGIQVESGSSYTSFGYADPWVKIARDAGLSPWRNPETGKDQYRFDLTQGIDWAGRLKMIAP